MSHVICPFCGSNEHTMGYGLAAGPMGSYTFCDGCDKLIEFSADTEGMTEEQVAKIVEQQEVFDAKIKAAREAKT